MTTAQIIARLDEWTAVLEAHLRWLKARDRRKNFKAIGSDKCELRRPKR